MKSRLLANLLLAAVVAALAAFLLLRPGPAGEARHPVSQLKAESVRRIAIDKPGAASIVLEKRDGGWFLTEPLRGRADALKADRILELHSTRASTRLPADDLARFELDRPALTVTLNDEKFAFGMSQPITGERYLLAGDAVLLVPGFVAGPAQLPAGDLLSVQPLAEGEKPVAFRLPGLELSRAGGRWQALPERAELDQDALNRYADGWRLAYALDARPEPAPAQGEPLELTLEDGRTLRFVVMTREPEMKLYREDEGIAYRFAAPAGARLLNPLAKP